MEIRDVSVKASAKWRETWITIYGVPLNAWSHDTFFKIGCVFGKILSINYSNFEFTKILISIDCLFKINCKMALNVDGFMTKIHIWETPQFGCIHTIKSKKADAEDIPATPSKMGDASNLSPMMEEPPDTENLFSHAIVTTPLMEADNSPRKSDSPASPHGIDGSFSSPNKNNDQPTSLNNQSASQKIPCKSLFQDSQPQLSKPQSYHNDGPTPTKSPTFSQTKTKSPFPNQTKLTKLSENKPFTSKPKPDNILSQVQTSNRFQSLIKQKFSSSSCSTSSGPQFPPGFEESIPLPLKMAHEMRRQKKLKKKIKRKKQIEFPQSKASQAPLPTPVMHQGAFLIDADDVLQMGKTLGVSFRGDESELKRRIENILISQQSNWNQNPR